MLTVKNPNKHDWANMSMTDIAEGNATDAYYTWQIFYLLLDKLKEVGLYHFYEKLICPLTPVFARMEYNGLDVNQDTLAKLDLDLQDEVTTDKQEAMSFPQIKPEDSLSSNKVLQEIFYTREGAFELYPPFRTKKGSPSTDKETLEKLLEQIDEELGKRLK